MLQHVSKLHSFVRLNNVLLTVHTHSSVPILLSFTALQIHKLQQDHESALHNHVSVCQRPLWFRNHVLHYFLSLCSVGIPCLWHSGWWLQYFPRVYVSIYEIKKKSLIRDVTAFSGIKDKSSWLLFNPEFKIRIKSLSEKHWPTNAKMTIYSEMLMLDITAHIIVRHFSKISCSKSALFQDQGLLSTSCKW